MSAEKDNKTELRPGVNYTVEEMLYLIAVDSVLYPVDDPAKHSYASVIDTLETLPGDSFVCFDKNPETQALRITITTLGFRTMEFGEKGGLR